MMSQQCQSQLVKAILQEDNITLRHLLSIENVDPNLKTKHGYPLQVAIFPTCKNMETLRLLLDAGADPNLLADPHSDDGDKFTILEKCICDNDLEAVKLLVKRGAKVDYRDDHQRTCTIVTVLFRSVFYEHVDIDIIKFLLDSKAVDVNAVNSMGQTPLHFIGLCSNSRSIVCRMLIDAGADVDAMDYDGKTPLHITVVNNKIEVFVLLVENGANPFAFTGRGDNALHLACTYGHVAMVQLLIKIGIPINSPSKDVQRFTPLQTAVYCCHPEIVFCLVKAGANVHYHAEGFEGDNDSQALIIAASKEDKRCFHILLMAGSRPNRMSMIEELWIGRQKSPAEKYLTYLSSHPRSLSESCKFIVRNLLAPHLQTKAYLLPIAPALQKEIALVSLEIDDIDQYKTCPHLVT